MNCEFLFLTFFACCATGLPFRRDWRNLGIKLTEKVTVKLKSKDRTREKRSAHNYPESLTFQFYSQNLGDVEIDLYRNNIQNIPPVLLYDGIKLKNKTDINLGHFSLYQNADLKASALVKFYSDDFSIFDVHATCLYNSTWYTIEPVATSKSREKRSAAIPFVNPTPGERTTPHPAINDREHLVYQLLSKGFNFYNDTYIIKEKDGNGTDSDIPPTPQRLVERDDTFSNDGGLPVVNISNLSQSNVPDDSSSKDFMATRSKRQTKKMYLEYLVCVDYANFLLWKSMSTADTDEKKNSEAESMIIQYYLFITNGINTRFDSLNVAEGEIQVILAGFVIATKIEASRWTEDNVITTNVVNDGNTLLQFAQWINSNKNSGGIPKHDHAALFTPYDLAEKLSDRRTIGIAYLGRVCNSYASSVIEDFYNANVIHIAAHELGHGMGASHDSYSVNGCPSEMMHLMAGTLPNSNYISPSLSSNPFIFSSCSRSSIQKYLDELTTNCLTDDPLTGLVGLTLNAKNPGATKYDVDEQCRLTYAPNGQTAMCRENYPSTSMKWASVCYRLQCRNPDNPSGACSSQFAFDGTPCGYSKWCQQGQCVSSVDAPDVPDICPYGDDPLYSCDINQCSQYSQQIRAGRCCYTCLVPKTTTTPSTSTTTPTTPTTSTTTPTTTTTTPTTTSTPTTTTTTTPTTTTTTPTTTTTTPTTTTTTPTTTTTATTTTTTPTTTTTTPTTTMTTTGVVKTTSATPMFTPITPDVRTRAFGDLSDFELETAVALFVHLAMIV